MTPDVQWTLQQMGYDPERAAEALPTLMRLAVDVMRELPRASESTQVNLQKRADAVLALARY